MEKVHGEASHHLATPEVDFSITGRGGHLAPVVFHLPGRDVSPYALAPWEPDEFPDIPPLLSVLRGDFFCLPFGEQSNGPPHGDPANAVWTMLDHSAQSLHLVMETSDSGARIDKILSTRTGQHGVFSELRISNLTGKYNYGTHPILDLSDLPEGSGRVSTSAFKWASVFPGPFSNPAAGETQALAEGHVFTDLREVKLTEGGHADLTRYPARRGNEDLVMIANVSATASQPFAWSAVVFDGYLWFALKNPADFPASLLWMSNGGRSAPPWNGRHLGRIGVEEVCSYFCNGMELSKQDLLSDEQIPTSRHFHSDETVVLKTIHAVALVPENFGQVSQIIPHGEQCVCIRSEIGGEIVVALDWRFVI